MSKKYLAKSPYAVGDTVRLKSGNVAKVCKTDVLNKKVEVMFNDESYSVVDFERIESIESKDSGVDKLEMLLLKHYENDDNTYTVPKELIHYLLNFLGSELEVWLY